eukprot:CAMPEP_0197418702 /NCGR_PEP_ID=MMETSP1170-20131217/4328_1 /TAXON_ID=54406 /ORGANISM="Sarcinochrysis sp, Strain CCMP770" /LENGTH=37 /DNA_ID= /DNA_START= /DNA_END= /DNA_ORIENTATION=
MSVAFDAIRVEPSHHYPSSCGILRLKKKDDPRCLTWT